MSSASPAFPGKPEPAWEIARLFPSQGHWSEATYLSFTETVNQLVELVDGCVEVLEMPTKSHQKIVHYLLSLVLTFLTTHQRGDAISAPYRVRLRGETYREPDIVVYLAEHLNRFGERYGERADVVMEVVSNDPISRKRDYEDKRRDYADAGIPEYWIVDPAERRISVLHLKDNAYALAGEYSVDDVAKSVVLNGFSVNLAQLLQVAEA